MANAQTHSLLSEDREATLDKLKSLIYDACSVCAAMYVKQPHFSLSSSSPHSAVSGSQAFPRQTPHRSFTV